MIKYNLKLTNVEGNPELVSYLEEKISQMSKFIHGDLYNVSSDIELGKMTEHHKQGDIFRAEMNIKLEDGTLFRADATAGDLFSAIDLLKSKISKEVNRHYDKENTMLKRGGRAIKRMLKNFRD